MYLLLGEQGKQLACQQAFAVLRCGGNALVPDEFGLWDYLWDFVQPAMAASVDVPCILAPVRFSVILLTVSTSLTFAASAPSADTLKQALSERWKSLRPSGMTERDVLFQEVRPGTPAGGSFPFQVTAIVRDYGPGYPANRFYGETCVSRFDKARFALSPDAFGGWQVEGAMTPSMDARQCKRNPSAGVSSIPLSTLEGSPAPAGNTVQKIATAAPVAAAGSLAPGSYECWANGQARGLMNFTIRSTTQYTGSDGQAGSYRYDAGTGRVTFDGGALDGVMPAGFYAMYHAPGGKPTVSFRSAHGSEAAFCERVK